MWERLRHRVSQLAALGLFLYAPIGLVLAAATPPQSMGRRARAWLLVALLLIPLLIQQLAAGSTPRDPLEMLVLVVAGGSLLHIRRKWTAVAGTIALTLFVAVLGLERLAAARTWDSAATEGVTLGRIVDMVRGSNHLQGGAWDRFWGPAEGTAALHVSFDARLTDGVPGTAWIPYHPDFVIAGGIENGLPYTRIVPPAEGPSYVTRRISTDRPLGGRTFRARLEIRAAEEVLTSECAGLILREVRGSGSYGCLPIEAGTTWQPFELVWTAPPYASSHILRVELRIPARSYDTRAVVLEELRENSWTRLEPLEPAGAWLRVAIPGEDRLLWPGQGFVPTETWATIAIDLRDRRLRDLEQLRTLMVIEEGLELEIRNLVVTDPSGRLAAPLPRPARQDAWYPHPNVAAHAFVAVGLASIGAATSLATGATAAVLSLATLYFTTSRAAWLALLVGLPWLLWFTTRRARVAIPIMAIIIASVLLITALGLGSIDRLQLASPGDINAASRLQIWSAGWNAAVAKPWRGHGEEGFPDAWRREYPAVSSEAPTHAHNFVLQWAVAYGAIGLATAALLLLALIGLAWRWGRWEGLAFMTPIVMLQAFDYTLVHPAVLLPVLLALNTLRAAGDEATDAPAGRQDP